MNRQKSELLGRVPSCPGVSLINRSYDCFSSIDLSGVQSLTSDTLAKVLFDGTTKTAILWIVFINSHKIITFSHSYKKYMNTDNFLLTIIDSHF